MTLMSDNKITHLIIDRTFVDNGVRWIIDYKTASPENMDEEQFFSQQRLLYQKQLQTYAIAMRHLAETPIRMGLYFPLFAGWCECEE